MERFPYLNGIVRFGRPGSIVLTLLAFVVATYIGWTLCTWVGAAVGIVIGGLVFILARAFVEIVVLITEMLLPQ